LRASAWSEALAVEGRQSPSDEVAAIQRVTVADVNRVARRYLDLDHAITAIMTPRPSGNPVTSKAFGGKESFTLLNTKPVALPAWAESAVKRLAVPRSSVNPVVTTLPNGLRLIVQPESVSNTISVVGHVKTRPALEAPPGQEGVDEVLEGLFDFGTESLDRVAYQKALDEIGADAGAGADFAVGVLAEHFDRGVQLLADSELRPALPEAAFAIVQKQVADSVAGRVQSAEYQARMRRAKAEMRAEAECDVWIRLSIESHFLRTIKCCCVEICRRPAQRHPPTGRNRDAVDIRLHRADAADVRERRDDAEEFLDRVDNACRIPPQKFERFRVFGEMAEHRRDGVDDSVASTGENEVGKAHHFFACERTSAIGCLGQRTEKIVALGHLSTVELCLQITFQRRAFRATIAKHMDTPTDPQRRLGLGHVKQIGECP